MIKMEALQYQNYEGRWYQTGDQMEVKNELDANDMVAMNLAKRNKSAPITRDVVSSEDPTGDVAVAVAPTEKTKNQNKRYNHREMRPNK